MGPAITSHLLGNNQLQGINVNADGLDLGTTGQIDLLDHLTQMVINACHLVKVEAASLVLSKAVAPSAPRPPTRTSAFTALMILIFYSIHTAFLCLRLNVRLGLRYLYNFSPFVVTLSHFRKPKLEALYRSPNSLNSAAISGGRSFLIEACPWLRSAGASSVGK